MIGLFVSQWKKDHNIVTYGEERLLTINQAHRFAIVVVLSHVPLARVDRLGTGSMIDLLTLRGDVVGTSNDSDSDWRWLSVRILNTLEELLKTTKFDKFS